MYGRHVVVTVHPGGSPGKLPFNGWNTPRMLPFPECLSSYGMQQVRSFERCNHVVVKPSSGPGAWSAVTLFAVWKSGMAISDHKDS
jgi:hypothetical protein